MTFEMSHLSVVTSLGDVYKLKEEDYGKSHFEIKRTISTCYYQWNSRAVTNE